MNISRSSGINSNIDANLTDANVGMWSGPPSVYLTIIGLLALTSSSLKYDLTILTVLAAWRKWVDGWKILSLRVI